MKMIPEHLNGVSIEKKAKKSKYNAVKKANPKMKVGVLGCMAETGVNTNGKQNWIHVLSNKKISFFGHHRKRGKEAIDEFNLIPLYKGNLVHDRFSSYFSYNCLSKLIIMEAVKTHFRTCNLCKAMCGLEITYQDKTILNIKGDKKDDFSKGHICPKAVTLQDLYHDKDRLIPI